LREEQICQEAKILMVADVVEAINSHRPYRPALGIDVALEDIRSGRGTIYCPEVVDACIALFEQKGYSLEQADY
jgi:HD-GYP domain-containing protein (c-di-GMP phosphodiesterase class II)